MKRLSILSFLALFAGTLTHQGAAWAQEDTKDENWGQIKTATSEWTHITAGSTKGFELRNEYYYVTKDLTFTNENGGDGQGSGLYVQAGRTVNLYIPAGVTITAIGADADTTSAAGAGILLPSGSTLNILGSGTVIATGGNAANGKNGGKGTDGMEDTESPKTWFLGKKILCGLGGAGGDVLCAHRRVFEDRRDLCSGVHAAERDPSGGTVLSFRQRDDVYRRQYGSLQCAGSFVAEAPHDPESERHGVCGRLEAGHFQGHADRRREPGPDDRVLFP